MVEPVSPLRVCDAQTVHPRLIERSRVPVGGSRGSNNMLVRYATDQAS
jgi:hypothetical protein